MGKKRIAYYYCMNYFGKGTFDGIPVNGVSIDLNIRAYKDGEEILFNDGDELSIGDKYLDDVYSVYFNRERLLLVIKNRPVYDLFLKTYGWDRMEAEIVSYNMDVITGSMENDEDDDDELPEFMRKLPVEEPVSVDKDAFMLFLKTYADDLDIGDNKPAQVPGVTFYDLGEPVFRKTLAPCS